MPLLRRHAANLVSLGRALLVIPAVALLSSRTYEVRVVGLVLLVLAFLLDGLDGILARHFGTSGTPGSLIDVLGDRISENVVTIFLAWSRLIPIAVPVIFVTRSFLSDAIRTIAYKRGLGTFALHTSRSGRLLIASPVARVAYLLVKMTVFFLGGLVLTLQEGGAWLRPYVWWGSLVATAFSCLRFAVLCRDGRALLARELGWGSNLPQRPAGE